LIRALFNEAISAASIVIEYKGVETTTPNRQQARVSETLTVNALQPTALALA
jgi:hypothetical protein